jgi:hypothetical protein
LVARLRRNVSFANVVSLIALFVALGGSSYAAVKLSKNSVKSKHIAKGEVRAADLARNSVSSGKVTDGSLLVQDFATSTRTALKGDQGPKGDAGPPGAKGDPGAPAPEAWALYNGFALVAGEGVTSITQAAIAGQYRVVFEQTVRNECAIFVSPGDWTTATINPDAINVAAPKVFNLQGSGSLREVTVAAHTLNGADTTGGFSVAAFC